jgi:hypothetical protein
MTKFFIVHLIFLMIIKADTLHDTPSIKLGTTKDTDAKSTIKKLIKNEEAAADIYPYESDDLQTIMRINNNIGFSLYNVIYDTANLSDSVLNSSKSSELSNTINILLYEKTSISGAKNVN